MIVNEFVGTIRNQLAEVVSEYSRQTGQAIDFEVCSFRDMMERAESAEEFSPRDIQDRKKLFFVVSIGQGERNFAVEKTPVTIQCLSMDDTVVGAYDILASFVATWSFCSNDGFIQIYYMPTVSSPASQIFSGYRALCSVDGVARTVDSSVMIFDDIVVYDGETPLRIPFVSIGYSYQASSDPRAFSEPKGDNGTSESLNTTNVKSLSVVTYMWNAASGSAKSSMAFSSMVMEAMKKNQNKKFHIALHANLTDVSGGSGEDSWIDDWYVLKTATTQQGYFEPSTWTFVFAKAREKEDGE